MPQPTTSLATLRPDLADGLDEISLVANRMGFVGLQIAPVFEVPMAFGQFKKLSLKELLKKVSSDEQKRAPAAGYKRIKGRFEKDSYTTEEYGIEEAVDENEANMYREWYEAELLAVQRAQHIVAQGHNDRVITTALANSNTTAAGTVWTSSSSDPVANVITAKNEIRTRTGAIANAMCVEWETAEHLRNNDAILDRIKYSGRDDPKQAAMDNRVLAEVFNVEHFIVSGAVENTANEGQAVSVGAQWDNTKCLVFKRYDGRDLRQAQFMRTFHWGADGSQIGGVVEEYRDETVRGDIYRVRMQTQEKELMADAAEVITGVQS